jgi:hypothetical protein
VAAAAELWVVELLGEGQLSRSGCRTRSGVNQVRVVVRRAGG